jgi:hypothetical protein
MAYSYLLFLQEQIKDIIIIIRLTLGDPHLILISASTSAPRGSVHAACTVGGQSS